MPEQVSETILVVDDDPTILSLIHEMLAQHGYTVLVAATAEEALRFLQVSPEQWVHLAVLDIVMPVMDGFELAERLREIRPTIPILYMSAYSDDSELRPEKTRGIPDLAKPFTWVMLKSKIREMLERTG